jgi:CubicO group peptidase (beta-lactamase class C family)
LKQSIDRRADPRGQLRPNWESTTFVTLLVSCALMACGGSEAPMALVAPGGAITRSPSGTPDASSAMAGGGSPGSGVAEGDRPVGADMQPGSNATPAMPGPDPATSSVTACAGNPLPKRALGTPGPYSIGPASAGLQAYWPTDDWRAMEPAMLGFDPAKLREALDYNPHDLNAQALLVIRHGYIAAEKYFGDFTQTSRHQSFSMAKSFSSALLGVALAEGKVPSVDEKLCKYYPAEWDCNDPSDKHSTITIHHAMTLTTGLEWNEDWRSNAPLSTDVASGDLVQTALSKPVVDEPGTKARYSTADPALLRDVFRQATGMGVLEYGRQVLFDAIGLRDLQWNGETYYGIETTAREYAKFGYLYLNRGMWDGQQLIPAKWVEDTTRQLNDKDPESDPDVCQDWYYYLWHINLPNRLGSGVNDPNCASQFCTSTQYADLPPEGYFAEGLAGQYIFVIPSADLVLVRLADDGYSGIEIWDADTGGMLERVLDAIL